MKKSASIIFLLTILLGACNSNQKGKEEVVEKTVSEVEPQVNEVSPSFKSEGVQKIYGAYEQLRDALVATDFETAKNYAKALGEALTESQNNEPQSTIVASIIGASSIDDARAAFSALSEGMETILTGSLESGEINKCFCPMANDNTGAYWFSTSKEIYNPYFGDKMLKCGSVEATVK